MSTGKITLLITAMVIGLVVVLSGCDKVADQDMGVDADKVVEKVKSGHLFEGQQELIEKARSVEKQMADRVKEQLKQVDEQSQ